MSVRAGLPWRFETEAAIRFGHCDPAGIAYFPRLDELLNGCFEDWCAAVGLPFHLMMGRDRLGFPLVHATVDYEAALRLGDQVTLTLAVEAVGSRSLTLEQAIVRDGTRCLRARHVRVVTSLDHGRAVPLPDALRVQFGPDAQPSP